MNSWHDPACSLLLFLPPIRQRDHRSSYREINFSQLLSRDYFFAEMLSIKLDEIGFKIWRDQGSIRAGDDWRQTIEEGIKNCFAVVVALSSNSAESPYVTFE